MDYTDPKNRINENLEMDYKNNPIPTLIINKPKDKKISLNFPSTDYLEKPSNKFSLLIDNIIPDINKFDEAEIKEVYTDNARLGNKNYDWLTCQNSDVIVDDEDTTFINNSDDTCYFRPNTEFDKGMGFYLEMNVKNITTDINSTNITVLTDTNKNKTLLELGEVLQSHIGEKNVSLKILLLDDYLYVYVNDEQVKNQEFVIFNDETDGESYIVRIEITGQKRFNYNNFIIYGLEMELYSDKETKWTNEDKATRFVKTGGQIVIETSEIDEPVTFAPTIKDTQYFMSGDNNITFTIDNLKGNAEPKLIFEDIYDNSQVYDMKSMFKASESDVQIQILDNKIYIITDNQFIIKDEPFKLNGLYSIGIQVPEQPIGVEEKTMGFVFSDFTISKPIGIWKDDGGSIHYNDNTIEYEPTTEIEHTITGTTFKSTNKTNHGYVIPTLNGEYDTPYLLKTTSEFIIDYYYTNDTIGHNSLFITNRLRTKTKTIPINELGIKENCRLKMKVTNENGQNANIKIYIGEFETDNYNTVPAYDKDITIDMIKTGYSYGLKQSYNDTEFKFKNLKIQTHSYNYEVGVICRGYDETGAKTIWDKLVKCDVNTNDRKLLAQYDDVPINVKYIDFVLLIEDERIDKLEINKIMLYEGLTKQEYSQDTHKENLSMIDINFNRTNYCNYYNSASSDPTGLSIIRPTFEPITLKTIPAPIKTDKNGKTGATVLYPYLKKAKDYNTPDKVAIEYLNSSNQTLRLIYNG